MILVTCIFCRREVFEPTPEERDETEQALIAAFGEKAIDAFNGWTPDAEFGRMRCRVLHGGRLERA